MKKGKEAFTLMEVMVVLIILGLIVGFAVPNYQNSVNKAYETDAVDQLTSMHAAALGYYAAYNTFPPAPSGGGELTINQINQTLNMSVIPNDIVYSYASDTATTFSITATHTSAATNFEITITQAPITADVNPCCSDPGTCPSLADC